MRGGLVVALVMLLVTALYADSRRAYTLGMDPPAADASGGARVVVRLGRRRWSFLNFLPIPRLGSIIADTGYTAGGLETETAARIAAGRVSGTIERPLPATRAPTSRALGGEVLNGLKPVPRGIVKAILGDPDGVVALKQAFSDPAARSEILSALAVIGHGGAGEDEILAGALADASPEIRRRRCRGRGGDSAKAGGGERQGRWREAGPAGSRRHAARGAGRSLSRRARRRAGRGAALLPTEAAAIVTLALRDSDPTLRRRAEEATEELAQRAPAAVVDTRVKSPLL